MITKIIVQTCAGVTVLAAQLAVSTTVADIRAAMKSRKLTLVSLAIDRQGVALATVAG